VYLQKEAVHYTVLLLPDEHREALFALLDFLCRVSSRSNVNQMSASNLAVCLAPSLFHLGNTGTWSSSHPHGGGSTPSSPVTSHNRSSSVSPRRNHHQSSAASGVGLPDSKQLGQNKAAHDCLLFLVKHYRQLFAVRTLSPWNIFPLQRCAPTAESSKIKKEFLDNIFFLKQLLFISRFTCLKTCRRIVNVIALSELQK